MPRLILRTALDFTSPAIVILQTILLGAIARFQANESLALRMYFASTNSLGTKRVLISVLASIGEIANVLATTLGISDKEVVGLDLTGPQQVLIIGSVVNIFCL